MVRSPRVIIAARALSGLSQEELADAAGIPVGVLRNLEQGRTDPRNSTILALVDALAKLGVRFMMESDRIAWGVYAERGSEAADATMSRDPALGDGEPGEPGDTIGPETAPPARKGRRSRRG